MKIVILTSVYSPIAVYSSGSRCFPRIVPEDLKPGLRGQILCSLAECAPFAMSEELTRYLGAFNDRQLRPWSPRSRQDKLMDVNWQDRRKQQIRLKTPGLFQKTPSMIFAENFKRRRVGAHDADDNEQMRADSFIRSCWLTVRGRWVWWSFGLLSQATAWKSAVTHWWRGRTSWSVPEHPYYISPPETVTRQRTDIGSDAFVHFSIGVEG